jgi:hypothetical protein
MKEWKVGTKNERIENRNENRNKHEKLKRKTKTERIIYRN